MSRTPRLWRRLLVLLSLSVATTALSLRAAQPRNIVFILTDDHRFDAVGFMGHPFLETPNLDALARQGAHLRNAFVTTSLCSPSRASILTGLYTHRHGVVDNSSSLRPDIGLFPQLLQGAGYVTGFFGKWHMGGDSSCSQRGFNKWVSFRGQGEYWPDRRGTAAKAGPPNQINVDGTWVPQKGYITDELTDYAVDWIRRIPREKPFFLYLSHKAAHGICVPADRHAGRYKDKRLPIPASRLKHEHAPMWVQNQRNSWHGIDFPYHNADPAAWEAEYQHYCETLLAVDESVGRLLDELRARGQLDETLVVYMGDNGFSFGDHGLIDKRTAYEWSMRVPLIARCPAAIPAGKTITPMVANIDLAPTLFEAAGVVPPAELDGRSFWPLLRGETVAWRTDLLYEYYWTRGFPQTPTLHALRTDRYKYVRVDGLWDLDEFYDLQEDPGETRNLIFSPEHAAMARKMNTRLFDILEASGGMAIPLQRDGGAQKNIRIESGSRAADFPPELNQKAPARP